MDDDALLAVLDAAVDAVHHALASVTDWGPSGGRADQYHSDVIADAAVLDVLLPAGVGVLSEESGAHGTDRPVTVVVDPLDGSTNASLRLPWYATSLCALDAAGPRVAVVANLVSGVRYDAVRGKGARADGTPLRPSSTASLGDAVVGISGYPPRHLGWRQFRAFGSAALDLCAVAAGQLDAYVDCSADGQAPWDYLGAVLVCREAGAAVGEGYGRPLVVRGHGDRRVPVAAGTRALLGELAEARASLPSSPKIG